MMVLNMVSRKVTLLTEGAPTVDAAQLALFKERGVAVREERVARLEGPGERLERVVLEGGGVVEAAALYNIPHSAAPHGLLEKLGVAFGEAQGPHFPKPVKLDPFNMTSVPGVFVAGDAHGAMLPPQQLASAVYMGSIAAVGCCLGLFGENLASGKLIE